MQLQQGLDGELGTEYDCTPWHKEQSEEDKGEEQCQAVGQKQQQEQRVIKGGSRSCEQVCLIHLSCPHLARRSEHDGNSTSRAPQALSSTHPTPLEY
eukprot:766811-Hanusia_phi.AAC.2